MNPIIKTILSTILALLAICTVIYFIVQNERRQALQEYGIKPDSVAQAKEALKSPVIQGRIAATIEHCKLYELKTVNGDLIYWSICYDAQGQISTSVSVRNDGEKIFPEKP